MQTQSSLQQPLESTQTLRPLQRLASKLPWRRISPLLALLSIILFLFGCATAPRPVAAPQRMMVPPDPSIMVERDFRAEWDKKVLALTSVQSQSSSSTTPPPK